MKSQSIILNLLALFMALSSALLFTGCPEKDNGDVETPAKDTTTAALPDPTGMPSFDAQAAYDYVDRQVSFGTREPNSQGAAKAIDFYLEELGKYADTVRTQKFTHVGYNSTTLNLTNIIASFNPDARLRILLCAHWDSRPRADMETDEAEQNKAILAANDGASGVGVLLEMARILKENPQPIGIDIVLFDGEDYGDSDIDNTDQYFLGAKYFAGNLPAGYQPAFGILLDMVGDKEAEFAMEAHSMQYAYGVVTQIWRAAAHLQLSAFKQVKGGFVSDDHLPLNQIAHIPTIDIIDIDLVGHNSPNPRRQYWHTQNDTMENISAETLGQVGRLLVYTIYKMVPVELNNRPA